MGQAQCAGLGLNECFGVPGRLIQIGFGDPCFGSNHNRQQQATGLSRGDRPLWFGPAGIIPGPGLDDDCSILDGEAGDVAEPPSLAECVGSIS